jgi:sortase A
MKRNIINIILIISIFAIFLCIILDKYWENNIERKEYNLEKISIREENINNDDIENKLLDTTLIQKEIGEGSVKQYPKEEFDDVYNGYNVCAKLEIPVIGLETSILSNYSEKALRVSVTKFWGVEPNQTGNFCVAGHNFRRKNMFHNLKKLNIGDNLFITDKEVGKVEYEIFKIYKVHPEDVNCLEPITKDKKEVTLITCTVDSKQRIIVKAKEK